jgi:hypothetical protein
VFAIGEIKRFYESPNPKDHNLYANIQIGDQPNVVYVPSLENCEIQSDYLVFKVGDRIRDKDGFEGVINDLDHNHLSIKSPDNIKCFNLKLCKEPLHKLISHISGNSDHAIATKPSESVAISRIDDVLVESKNVRALDARYQFLLERREELINLGACPDGLWINCGKVPHRDFKQAVWKSHKPRAEWGNKKSKYIGEFGKEAHISAIAQHRAGQELRKIEREIRKLQKS